jgi:hypothetical protein
MTSQILTASPVLLDKAAGGLGSYSSADMRDADLKSILDGVTMRKRLRSDSAGTCFPSGTAGTLESAILERQRQVCQDLPLMCTLVSVVNEEKDGNGRNVAVEIMRCLTRIAENRREMFLFVGLVELSSRMTVDGRGAVP